jgi:hypothetical protein
MMKNERRMKRTMRNERGTKRMIKDERMMKRNNKGWNEIEYEITKKKPIQKKKKRR